MTIPRPAPAPAPAPDPDPDPKPSPPQARIHLAMPHVTNLAAKALNPALVAMVAKAGVPLLGSRRLFTSVRCRVRGRG